MRPSARPVRRFIAAVSLIAFAAGGAQAQSATEVAGFLNIPVGSRQAAMGGAYAALADDAYAPVQNPGGLGYLASTSFAAMHNAYLDDVSYDFAAFVHPFKRGRGVGLSVQSLRPGDIAAVAADGSPAGEISGGMTVYSLGYGHAFPYNFSLGAVAKSVQARIGAYSARATAADVGLMARPSEFVTVAAAVMNWGGKMRFLEAEEPLPRSYRIGAACRPIRALTLAIQRNRSRTGHNTAQAGIEWTLADVVSVRGGYRTGDEQGTSGRGGFSAGTGLRLAGQQFDYAWVPRDRLGDAHYFSVVLSWGRLAGGDIYDLMEEEEDDAPSSRRRDRP